MIKALRQIDRLYFGDGHDSAMSSALAILTGVMPWGFVRRYRRGDFA